MTVKITKDQWIKEALTDPDKDGPCTALALVHRVGTSDEEIHTVRLDPKTRKLDEKKLAALFQRKAEITAQELPGVQMFALLAFYGERTEPQARLPFIVHGVLEFGGATEPPTAQGMTQQAQRLIEAITGHTFRQVDSNARTSETLIHTLLTLNQQLMADKRASDQMNLNMLVELQRMQNDQRFQVLQFERDNAMRQKLLDLAPAAINGLSGNEIFPQPVADSALLDRLAEVFDPADPQGSIQKDPMLVGLLMSRMQQALVAKHKREAERAKVAGVAAQLKLPNELGEGEKDAAE